MFAASVRVGYEEACEKLCHPSFLISHFVLFRLIPEDDEDDELSTRSLLRPSTSSFYVAITPTV